MLDHLIQNKAVYNTSSPGLGKTFMTISMLNSLNPERALIIAPAGVREQWASSLVELGEGINRQSVRVLRTGLSQPSLFKASNILSSYALATTVNCLTSFIKYDPEVLVIDEAHFLSSLGSKRTRMITGLIKNARKVILLSATPFDGCTDELFPVLTTLFPKQYPNIEQFRNLYTSHRKVFYYK